MIHIYHILVRVTAFYTMASLVSRIHNFVILQKGQKIFYFIFFIKQRRLACGDVCREGSPGWIMSSGSHSDGLLWCLSPDGPQVQPLHGFR